MDKRQMLEHTGTMQQLAFARMSTVQEGRANGLRTVDVKCGKLRYLVLGDKGLDIGALDYGGDTLSFTAKPGLNGRNQFDTHGEEALRSIMGGLFFTCGLENICGPCETDGKDYPMHGRIRTTPAEHLSADARWNGDDYEVTVSGELREAELFGENMVLRREISSKLGENTIRITDFVENQSCREETMMLMYHCNFGYPLLQPGTRLILPTTKVTPREDWSKEHLDCWETMGKPQDGAQEYVYIHQLAEDDQGNTFAAIVNDELGIGVRIDWSRKNLPYFMEWMSVASGDYVIGLEPSNSMVYGRKYHEKEGTLHTLAPYASETISWSFTVLTNQADIEKTEQDCNALLKK